MDRTERDPAARRVVSLDIWAWTAEQPTRLLTGTTIELGTDSALLRLPRLPEHGARLTLRICLPERAARTSATITRRSPPDIAEIVFHGIDPYERGRIRTFIDAAE